MGMQNRNVPRHVCDISLNSAFTVDLYIYKTMSTPPKVSLVPETAPTENTDPIPAQIGTEPATLAAFRANNPSGSNGKRPARESPLLDPGRIPILSTTF